MYTETGEILDYYFSATQLKAVVFRWQGRNPNVDYSPKIINGKEYTEVMAHGRKSNFEDAVLVETTHRVVRVV